jgi:hypothetical protein
VAVPAVWSSELYRAALATAGSFQTLYTVPSGKVLILKTASVRNASGVSSTLNLATTGPLTFHSFSAFAAAQEGDWNTWHVLVAGESILAFIDHQPWNIWLSGQLLTTP